VPAGFRAIQHGADWLSVTPPLTTVKTPCAVAVYEVAEPRRLSVGAIAFETTAVPDDVKRNPKGIAPVEALETGGPATPAVTG
jgi:hypothetical protein